MSNKTNDLSLQEKQNEEGQKNPNLLFDDEFLNKWYRGEEVHLFPHRYHVVYKGHNPGIYDNWPEAQKQIVGFSGCKHKAFDSLPDAANALKEWLEKEGANKGEKVEKS
jgi:viroplasmin and RNaseH domain-containing protein